MCLIFDSFESRAAADRFAATVAEKFGRRANVYMSQEESQASRDDLLRGEDLQGNMKDVFPFQLDPPIVLVERFSMDGVEIDEWSDAEKRVIEEVDRYGGTFAGT